MPMTQDQVENLLLHLSNIVEKVSTLTDQILPANPITAEEQAFMQRQQFEIQKQQMDIQARELAIKDAQLKDQESQLKTTPQQ